MLAYITTDVDTGGIILMSLLIYLAMLVLIVLLIYWLIRAAVGGGMKDARPRHYYPRRTEAWMPEEFRVIDDTDKR